MHGQAVEQVAGPGVGSLGVERRSRGGPRLVDEPAPHVGRVARRRRVGQGAGQDGIGESGGQVVVAAAGAVVSPGATDGGYALGRRPVPDEGASALAMNVRPSTASQDRRRQGRAGRRHSRSYVEDEDAAGDPGRRGERKRLGEGAGGPGRGPPPSRPAPRAAPPSPTGGAAGTPPHAPVGGLDSLHRHMLGSYGGAEFDTPNLDRFAAGGARFDQPRDRLAAVHAGPPRHPVRRPRLPVAAVGVDRGLGGPDHRRPAGGGRHHDAGVGPPAPVRDRRRELPHRLQRLGLRARPRGRPVAHPRRPVVDGRRPPARRAARRWTAPTTTTRRARGSGTRTTSRPRTMAAGGRLAATPRRHHDRFLLFVDEFDPHEPFDTPEPWDAYDPDWDGDRGHLAAVRRGRRRPGLIASARRRTSGPTTAPSCR